MDDPEMLAAWHRFKVGVLSRLLLSAYGLSLLVVLLGVLRTLFGKIAVRKPQTTLAPDGADGRQLAKKAAGSSGSSGASTLPLPLPEAVRSACLEAATTRFLDDGLERLNEAVRDAVEEHTADWDLQQLVTEQKLQALLDRVREQTERVGTGGIRCSHSLAAYVAPLDDADDEAAVRGHESGGDGDSVEPQMACRLLDQAYDIFESPNSSVVINVRPPLHRQPTHQLLGAHHRQTMPPLRAAHHPSALRVAPTLRYLLALCLEIWPAHSAWCPPLCGRLRSSRSSPLSTPMWPRQSSWARQKQR